MGQKNLGEMPKAVSRAYAFARVMQGHGYSVEVKIETEAASYYTSGEVMFPPSVIAWVTAKDEYMGVWGDTFTSGWKSYAPGFGRPATTRWISGFRQRTLAEMKKFASERKFWMYATMDDYRKEDPDKYGIVPEDSRITAPEWTAEDWAR